MTEPEGGVASTGVEHVAEESKEGCRQVNEGHGDDDQLYHLVGVGFIPATDRVHDAPVEMIPANKLVSWGWRMICGSNYPGSGFFVLLFIITVSLSL